MNAWGRPAPEEIAGYYHGYIALAEGDDLVRALQKASDTVWNTVYLIPAGRAEHRYAPGKWSIKEVFQHVIDSERIFAYRALRFARNDRTELPGYEENDYVPEARVERRGFHQLLREHDVVRNATIELFRSFDEEMLLRSGTANKNRMSVRALGWTIAGHAMHHMRVITERYLEKA
jgi:uncharacterized damage-inducible protein DinB